MKVKGIYTNNKTKVFVVTNQEDENVLNWSIEPTDFELIPEEENTYFVKAFKIEAEKTIDCYIQVDIPERIAEIAIIKNWLGQTVAKNISDIKQSVIPAVASDCFGDYELYYAKENPHIGLSVLHKGLEIATNKNVVGEDLGYILRDEGKYEEAIKAFKISEENGPSSEYIYLELSRLFQELGHESEQIQYAEKFKANGGIE